jgi:hypothetical protein
MKMSNRCLTDYYRCDESLAPFTLAAELSAKEGYFRLGPDTICYGQLSSGNVAGKPDGSLEDVAGCLTMNGPGPCLPFDPVQVIENLRRERYESSLVPGRERMVTKEWVHQTYYFVRNILPDPLRRCLQRAYFSDWKSRPFPAWPVDLTVDLLHEKLLRHSMEAAGLRRVPFIWFWPCGAPSCLILTHDVETAAGRDFTARLMELDESYGFKASFQVIPEQRYEVSEKYVGEIRSRGFEFNIHDLNHDGRLYQQREEFLRRAKQINQYARHYQAQGFRAGSMYRIQDWFDAYEFSYDMSVPNVAHLEPKRGGCCTVFPYFIGRILELPLTTSQDYSIFHILRDHSLDLWKRQFDLIRRKNGLISLLSHPDYLISLRTRKVYEALLEYLRHRVDSEQIWTALPGEVDQWWRARSQMKLVRKDSGWEIEGPQKGKARVAYAVLEGDHLQYELGDASAEGRAEALSTEPLNHVHEK